MSNLSVKLGELTLKNPVIPASGTFGFGYEFAKYYDLNILGSMSLKGTTKDERYGNPLPRIAETERGLINAIGLQNPGVNAVIEKELPKLKPLYNDKVIANISGFSIEEYVETAMAFDKEEQVGILEINISCPNVKAGGMAFGTSPENAALVCREVKKNVKKPVFIILGLNVRQVWEKLGEGMTGELEARCKSIKKNKQKKKSSLPLCSLSLSDQLPIYHDDIQHSFLKHNVKQGKLSLLSSHHRNYTQLYFNFCMKVGSSAFGLPAASACRNYTLNLL